MPYPLSSFLLSLILNSTPIAVADPEFFQKGGCKYESSRQTSQGERNGRGGVGWGEGLELAGYVSICRFFHLDFRGIWGTIHISSSSTVAWWSLRDQRIAFQQVSSDIVDLEQVLIRFIDENDRSASALVIGRVLGKASSSKSPTARLFSIYVPHFQGIWEMKCSSPIMTSTSSSNGNQTISKTSQGGGGATPSTLPLDPPLNSPKIQL